MTIKALVARLFDTGSRFIRRYPGVVALFGFVSGVASFVLVDRQAGLAKVVALIMLVSWVWLMLEKPLRRAIHRLFGWDMPPPLLHYATQLVHQESLFFIVPFFFITTTWHSGQAVFTLLLGAAALVSLVDPLYYRWLARKRWLYLAFHSLTLFAALLTALPIMFHLSTPQSYQLALVIAVLLAIPSLGGALPVPGLAPRAGDRRPGLGGGPVRLVRSHLGAAGHALAHRSERDATYGRRRAGTRTKPARTQRSPAARRRALCLHGDQCAARPEGTHLP